MKNKMPEKSPNVTSLMARINRKLALQNQKLHKSRPRMGHNELGDYYIKDFNRNFIVDKNVDIERVARELGLIETPEANKHRLKEAKDLVENILKNGKPAYKAVKKRTDEVVYRRNP